MLFFWFLLEGCYPGGFGSLLGFGGGDGSDNLLDCGTEGLARKGSLYQIIGSSQAEDLSDSFIIVNGSESHHGYAGVNSLNLGDEVGAANLGEDQVDEEDVGWVCSNLAESLLAVAGYIYIVFAE